ncbi:MAG: N-acyl homoserine lactonase family protein [Acidobacteria bacterium]|nr:N-acyl homoserine lactonase family protein [Acidobacteriota bacterium]
MRRRIVCLIWAPVFFLIAAGRAQSADVKVYAFDAGILKTQTQYMLKDTRVGTAMDIPIPFLVIKHGKEWIAFDTGCNRKVAVDPFGYLGEEIAKACTPVIRPDQEFREAIKVLGLKPRDFKAVVCSHGHFDHAGAIGDFVGTNVPIYFQRAEIVEIRKIVNAQKTGTAYVLGDFKHLSELNIRVVDGPFDVFGDKSVIAFPTPGHTPGHQSLYVKPSDGKAFIYCSDALYTLENMEKFIPPGLAADIPSAMQTINWFRFEEWTGVKIVPSHDPEYWSKHAWAPSELVP